MGRGKGPQVSCWSFPTIRFTVILAVATPHSPRARQNGFRTEDVHFTDLQGVPVTAGRSDLLGYHRLQSARAADEFDTAVNLRPGRKS